MKNDTSSMVYSFFMGVVVILLGICIEPLLVVLGGVIAITGIVAGRIENRKRRYMSLETEREKKQEKKVA